MTTRERFEVAYGGKALDDGTMDVREFAPALMSIGNLCADANRVLNQDRTSVSVRVRATREGCFGVELDMAVGIIEQARSMFTDDGFVSAKELLGAIGLLGGGLIGLLINLKGKTPTIVDNGDDTATFQVEGMADQKVDKRVAALFVDKSTRTNIYNVVAPLQRDGIDTFLAGVDGSKLVGAEALKYVDPPRAEDALGDPIVSTRTELLQIRNLAFEEGNVWRMFDGQNVINVRFADPIFQARIDSRDVSFTKGDRLEVELKVEKWELADGGLKQAYTITHVIDHRHAPRQLKLDNALGPAVD